MKTEEEEMKAQGFIIDETCYSGVAYKVGWCGHHGYQNINEEKGCPECRAEAAESKLASARKAITMFDVTRTDALTAEERQNITLAIMPALLDENRSNLCLLLARYEQAVVEVEADLKQAREELLASEMAKNSILGSYERFKTRAEAAEQREKVLQELLEESKQFCLKIDCDGDNLNIELARRIHAVLAAERVTK